MKKRVVILGSNGFVGSNIIKNLDPNIYAPISVARNECDFSSEESRNKLSKIIQDGDIIVCAAAKAPAKNLEMLTENVAIITNIAEALRTKKISYLLNISSDAVYADSMDKISESSEVAPLSAHGIMHCMREYILEKRIDAPVGHLRSTLIFGEGDPHNGYGPNSFIRLAQAANPISLFGNGEEQRDHIYVGDVAKIAISMISKKQTGAVNAVRGKTISFMEIAELVKKSSAKPIEIICKPRSGPMPHNGYRAFTNDKILEILPGFKYKEISDYIKEMVQNNASVQLAESA